MLEILRGAWKIKDLRKKILFTLLLLVLYRLGAFIPIPGVNPAYIAEMVGKYDILGFMDIMSGGSFANFTLFAMGIAPYINASIIINLLTIAIPALERLAKEGEEGRAKIERITRYCAIVFSLITSVGIILGLGPNAVSPSPYVPIWFVYATIGIVATAGSALLMWMGERITEVGIGNGISLLIFTSIISRVPSVVISTVNSTIQGTLAVWVIPVVLVLIIAIIAGVVYVDLGVRRVPVQYAKRVVGRKQYGGQSTHIPMRVNASGVLPLIFAITLVQFPSMIAQFWPTSGFSQWYYKYLGTGSAAYFLVYAALIILFAFFYTTISFNPIQMSKNLQEYGGFIPGIRPGRPTSDYLSRISNRLTLVGALFLAIIAAVPTLFTSIMGSQSAFGATSVLIMVNVALEMSKNLQAQMTMRHYKGFLK